MSHFNDVVLALNGMPQEPLEALFDAVSYARSHGNTVWICGNGGSHAVALHWACDLEKAAGVRARVLGCNPSLLTALSNDSSYENAFARELDHARMSDVLICLSCSGTSPNIRAALDISTSRRMITALITGRHNNGESFLMPIRVPSKDYGVIEDCFGAIGHWLVKKLRG